MAKIDDAATKGRHRVDFDSRATREPEERLVPPCALRLERPGLPQVEVALEESASYRLGRAEDSSWVFPDDAVSRQHGRLDFSNGRWLYRDLGSRNGTHHLRRDLHTGEFFTNQLRPNVDFVARPGDTLLLGDERNRVVFLDSPPVSDLRRPAAGGLSEASKRLEHSLDVAARHSLPILLLGHSGTGKTYAARSIHKRSPNGGAFISLNCARLPTDPAQLQSELLGHVAGSFTGATGKRQGKLWAADGGTLFLDEVESMPPAAQDFFLDVLEETGDFSPLGAQAGANPRPPQFRLISASKKRLRESGLRQDLCQRLAKGDSIILPSLEDRREDIPRFVREFAQRVGEKQAIRVEVTEEALEFLQSSAWPGQMRELEAAVDAVATTEAASRRARGESPNLVRLGRPAFQEHLSRRASVFGPALSEVEWPAAQTVNIPAFRAAELRAAIQAADSSAAVAPRKRPADLSRAEVEAALAAAKGNKTHAARALGIAVNTLKKLLKDEGE